MNIPMRGAAIAAGVVALLGTAACGEGTGEAEQALVKCEGINECKGQSDCGGKDGCGGQNACKGKGYLSLTKAECDKIPGTTFEAE